MKYNTVLFDADDTLLDFKLSEKCALTSVLKSFELPYGEETISIYSEINQSLWKLLELGGITKDALKVERFRQFCEKMQFNISADEMANRYVNELAKQSYIIKDADKVCERVYLSGIRTYIVTNGIKHIQTQRFNGCPLKKYFSDVFISEDIGCEKPNIEFFNKVFSSIGITEKEGVLLVGDSLSSDIKGGINAGIDTCWYNPHGKGSPSDMKITYEIRDLWELLDILEI